MEKMIAVVNSILSHSAANEVGRRDAPIYVKARNCLENPTEENLVDYMIWLTDFDPISPIHQRADEALYCWENFE